MSRVRVVIRTLSALYAQEPALEDVVGEEGAEVPDVRKVVHRGAAAVEGHPPRRAYPYCCTVVWSSVELQTIRPMSRHQRHFDCVDRMHRPVLKGSFLREAVL